MALLEVQDLNVYYGVIQALKNVSFDVEQGDIIALIGANGAGKTTTLHTISGLIRAKTEPILPIFRPTSWFPWAWPRYRRGGAYFPS